MYVRVQNGYEFDELHDVQILSPLNGDLIQYDQSTDLWKNKSLSGAGIQPTLVSGTSIKTVNGNSLLGSGNVNIGANLLGYSGTTGSSSQGSTVVISKSLLIPANTFTTDCIMELRWRLVRISGNTGQMYSRLYINTSNSLTGASLLSGIITLSGGSTQYSVLADKSISCSNSTLRWINTSSGTESTPSPFASLSINRSVNQYLLFTVQTTGTTEIATIDLFRAILYA